VAPVKRFLQKGKYKTMLWKILIVNLFLFSMTTFAQTMPPIEKGVSQTLAKWRAANYSDVRYKLNLTIKKKAPTLKGSIEVNVKLKTENGKLNPIILDWRKIKGHEKLSNVSNVSVNGKPLTRIGTIGSGSETKGYEEINEHLVFEYGVQTGENIIKLDFESPILTSGGAITRYIDKEDGAEYIYSLFVPSDASTAFPVFDQPDLKARFQLNLTIHDNWKYISNEVPVNKVIRTCGAMKDKATGKYVYAGFCPRVIIFKETKPISTYIFAFAAGEFEEFEAVDFDKKYKETEIHKKRLWDLEARITNQFYEHQSKIYVRKSQAEKFKPHAEEVFRLNRESIKYLEDYFDYKFPFPKYDLVLIPEFPFGGMEHAGATFLRESSVIFPTEPTANNYISRANLIFHENAHQWFGDTVTMKWFDDLWLKEGFATFMAYKAMEKVLPQYNAWKVFYERTKPLAYQTDVTRGTTPIYQEIPNLNSAKSAYGNIVYQKAPGFLRQAEFYLGEKEFQTAVRAFLKKHEFANAEWSDLVDAFEKSSGKDLGKWAEEWVTQRGLPIFRVTREKENTEYEIAISPKDVLGEDHIWKMKMILLLRSSSKKNSVENSLNPILFNNTENKMIGVLIRSEGRQTDEHLQFIFPNYQDYGYGIFLLDEKSKK
jgi:aminopeptidase N